jgi:hypothetical protein
LAVLKGELGIVEKVGLNMENSGHKKSPSVRYREFKATIYKLGQGKIKSR